jgi:hypothetical protein
MDKPGYFEDDAGNRSCMRVMSFISLLAAIGLAVMVVAKGSPQGGESFPSNGVILAGLFLVGAFAPKVFQKAIEKKVGIEGGGQ